mgnify:FL=1
MNISKCDVAGRYRSKSYKLVEASSTLVHHTLFFTYNNSPYAQCQMNGVTPNVTHIYNYTSYSCTQNY